MKRKLFIAIVAVLALSACMRDEDWKLLQRPIHLQGHVDPSYGVPVAYGKMTFNDILGMLSSTYTGHIYDNTDVITIYFDTNVHDTIKNIIPASAPSGSKTDPEFFTMVDTTMEYSVPITLFDNLAENELVGGGNITIHELLLNLHMILKALVPDNVETFVNNDDNVKSNVDNFEVYYTKRDGVEVQFPMTLPDQTLKHLIEGDTVDASLNLASIINEMPKGVRIKFHYDFKVSLATLFGGLSTTEMMAMKDSINKLRIAYDATMHAEFPFDIQINSLPYNFTINLNGDSIATFDIQQTLDSIGRGLSVNLNDAKLSLAFDNHIPADINISVHLLDANGDTIGDALIRDTRIASAQLTTDVMGNTVSSSATRSVVVAPINEQRLKDIKNTKKISFGLKLATGGTSTVRIRRTDFLFIKAFIMVHPTATADIPLTNQGLM